MAKHTQSALFSDTDSEPDAPEPHAPEALSGNGDCATSGKSTSASAPPESLLGAKVYAIDANSLIFQVFHAIPEMTGPRGEPVAAIYGFIRDILYLLEEKKPDYLFVAFDRAEKTFRHHVYDAYKAHRSEMPVDLVPQFPAIRRVLDAMNIPVLDCETYEADDILATIAHQTDQLEGECYLVTADKDCRQLITSRVKVYNVRKDQVYDACALMADWGIRPDQVVDFQSLVGDSIDNIPGVPLIGPKIARELLEKYDNLDELLAHADELPKGKRKENLLAGKEQAIISRELVRLERNVPVALDWEAAKIGGVDGPRLAALCLEFGFKSLAEKLSHLSARAAPEQAWETSYTTVDTPKKLAELCEKLSRQKSFALDFQTTSTWPRWADIVGIAVCWADGEAYYVPVRGPEGETFLDLQTTLTALRPSLENPDVEKVGHNLKHDMVALAALGIELGGPRFDTMVASYLLDAGERIHEAGELAARYLRHTTTTLAALAGIGKAQRSLMEVPVAAVAEYACESVDVAWRLRPILAKLLAESELDTLFDTLEMPLVEVLAAMEVAGIRVDRPRLAELSGQYGKVVASLEEEIYSLAGRSFNIGSPKQLQQVLFEEQQLPILKKTKTGGSTDVEVLEELALTHPLPAKIIEYRQYSKLKNTYVDALPAMVHPLTGRVHAAFNQVVAATGRLSASDPNLQNIPVRNERGREIRAAFLPDEGSLLVAADYSQIELRVLAHYSGDPELCEAFARDEDIHTRVASQVYHVSPEAVTADMRRTAKAVNFGVIYGQSPFGLAKTLGIEQPEAAAFITAYFDRFRGVEEFLASILEECKINGYVKTILGRRRAIRGVRSGAGRQRNLPERTAINTVIQGSAADLIKLAMIKIHRRLRDEKLSGRMLLQIHDELVFEVPSDQVQPLAQLVVEEMATAVQLQVPLKVDVKFGHNWSEC